MSSRPPPKPEENLKDKFMGLFRRNRPTAQLQVPKPAAKDFIITPQNLKDIGPECPANNRMKNIKELGEVVKQKKLEENAAEALWVAISDLVQPHVEPESRHQALAFLLSLIEGQLKFLGMLRGYFFHVIEKLDIPADLELRLQLFKVLSEDGKNLLDFEDETGPFLLKLMPDALSAGKIQEFLLVLINVIKFNAAYIDEDIMSGFVQQTCMIQNRSRSDEDMKLCHQVVDAVICYSFLPADALQYVVAALCHMVNKPRFCDSSWELMRKLMGTHLGHKTIYTLCCMMQDKKQPADFVMLRGAVFFTGMALWGSRRIACIKHSPSSVLPSFYQVLSFGSPLIAHEVALNVQRLVTKYGKDLTHLTWDTVFNILQKLLHQGENVPDFDPRVSVMVHAILTDIENLHQRGHFLGPTDRIFAIIEMCSSHRPMESVCRLIDYHARDIHPGKDRWIQSLHQLLEKFFRQETRTEVRKKALGVLSFILDLNKHVYEAEMIDKLLIPHFTHIDSDSDVEVRKMAVEILMGMAQGCSRDEFFDLIGIVDKITRKPLIVHMARQLSSEDEGPGHNDEKNLDDVRLAVQRLIDAFQHKLYTAPPSHCERLYELIISHMTAQYAKEYNTSSAANIRKVVMELLLQLRSDSKHRVGLVNRRGMSGSSFSAYVLCTRSETEMPTSPVAGSLSPTSLFAAIDYTPVLELFIKCLKQEVDWPVLITLLNGLPSVLENKTLVFSARGNLVYNLCVQICTMLSNPAQTATGLKLQRTPDNFKQAHLHEALLPVVAALVAYHHVMDKNRQREMVKCLEFGLVTGVAKVCVTSLRICSLEIQDLMMRMLPSVLLSLSKITATISMAIPVLAFLSSIVRLPKLYANFVEEQYMSVYAIAIPYTNPFKFSHYTVSLAHHVISIWYIRCRLPFRKGFAKYIQRGLKNNVTIVFEEKAKEKLSQLNMNSSQRSRSGSEGESYKQKAARTPGSSQEQTLLIDDPMKQFHDELTDANMDLLSRYAFGNMANKYSRSAMTEFLLAGGSHATWIVGNKLITITTSGGGSRDSGSGLCTKCSALLQQTQDERFSLKQDKRRRHKSAILTRSISENVAESALPGLLSGRYHTRDEEPRQTRDDICLGYEQMHEDAAVQTGSSLSSSFDPETLGPILLSWKSQIEEKAIWAADPCPCWCAGWAEVVIRGPSGDVAWVMRTENMPSPFGTHGDPSVPDISLLFSPVTTKSPDTDSVGKLDSGSLKEEEYESVHAEFFGWDSKSSCPSEGERTDSSSQGRDHEQRQDQGAAATLEMAIPSPSGMQKSNSSPSVISSSCDEMSPKEVIASLMKGQSRGHDENVKIRVDSSESRAIAAAGNFEGLEKSKSATEAEMRAVMEQWDVKHQGVEVTTAAGDGVETGELAMESDQECTPKASLDGSHDAGGREYGRSSSKLQAQLREYDLQQHEDVQAAGKTKDPQSSPTKHDAVTRSQEGLAVKFSDRPRFPTSPHTSSGAHPKRGHTISVMTPAEANRQHEEAEVGLRAGGPGKDAVGMVTPSQVFLQLYHTHPLISSSDVPILIPNTQEHERSLRVLDKQLPYEAHRIGVIYVGPGQVRDEKSILGNRYGSGRYMEFVQGLGRMLSLQDVEQNSFYLGGLGSEDGKFTYIWQDESMLVIFHIATLMPNKKSDPNYNCKKMHIGNDFVTIVYNDSGEDFKLGTLSGQFNFVNIVIHPLDHGGNAVTLLAKQDIADILGHTHPKIVSDTNLALLVRQIAVHCNMASFILKHQKQEIEPFASNVLERLRSIKRLRQRVLNELKKNAANIGHNYGRVLNIAAHENPDSPPCVNIEDFTDYV
ncbi:hypothetical protein BaRGS_00001091 [Batillaria attramentaria]|uniref:Rap-GAP domain-containing protein n=1 Tax=Batillaria attramentaria TaxID=370345 RepID=A0ABD0M6U8_9CAEN